MPHVVDPREVDTIRVRVSLFGSLRSLVEGGTVDLTLPRAATTWDLGERIGLPRQAEVIVGINGA